MSDSLRRYTAPIAGLLLLGATALAVTCPQVTPYRVLYNPYQDVEWSSDHRLVTQLHDHLAGTNSVREDRVRAYDDAGYHVVALMHYTGMPWYDYAAKQVFWPPEQWLSAEFLGSLRNLRLLIASGEHGAFDLHFTAPFLLDYVEGWDPERGSLPPKQAHQYASSQEGIDLVEALGAMTFIAHPVDLPPDERGFDGLEIYNAYWRYQYLIGGTPTDRNETAIANWDAMLQENPFLLGIATNDWIGPWRAAGEYPPTVVDSGKLVVLSHTDEVEGFRAALERGAFLAVRDIGETKNRYPTLSGILTNQDSIWILADGAVRWIGNGRQLAEGMAIDLTTIPTDVTYVRAEIRNAEGSTVYTQPIVLSAIACGLGAEVAPLLLLVGTAAALRRRRGLRPHLDAAAGPRRPGFGRRQAKRLLVCGVLAGFGGSNAASAQVLFEDATAVAAIQEAGQSWGASWGHYDADAFPDLYLTQHGAGPRLYRNQGDGTFVEVAAAVGLFPSGDAHGAAWADFDGDGDQDLVQITGASGSSTLVMPHRLFVNEGGRFTDRAAEVGVAQPLARGRNPLWWDRNLDGRLDLFVTNYAREDGQDPTVLFEQGVGGFTPRYTLPGSFEFAQMSDLMGDGRPELLLRTGLTTVDVLDPTTIPFVPVTASLGLAAPKFVRDVAIADFDGDLLPDLFFVRAPPRGAGWAITQSGQLRVSVPQQAEEIGVEFVSAGPITVTLAPEWSAEVFVGAGGINLGRRFSLDPANPQHHGIAPHVPGTRGVWAGYDPLRGVWVFLSAGSRFGWFDVIVDATVPITQVTPLGWDVASDVLEDLLYVHGPDGRFEEVGAAAGLGAPTRCWSGTAGDFDNDMDVDLFLVCTGAAANAPDRLYLNDGQGRFVAVPGAGGAAGTILGRGDSVASADYDGDGFLDLVVTNGDGISPLNDGPVQIFRNVGNANHWLEVDLRGMGGTNPPAIGARVLVEAGGVTQVREQNGGMHARTQDHTRLHFGLGPHAVVEELTVVWPKGYSQTLRNVTADRRVLIAEPACGVGAEIVLVLALLAMRRRAAPRGSTAAGCPSRSSGRGSDS